MAVKFSQFTTRTGTLDASTMIVGYDDPSGTKTNVEISLATLKANLDNIYTSDGTISNITRTVTIDSSSSSGELKFVGGSVTAGANYVYFYDTKINLANGAIQTSNSASSGFSIFSYGSALRKNYLSLYGTNGGYLNASVAGYWTISDTTGDAYGIDARLGIVGKHNDNTSYALRVQNSDSTDIFHVSNDTTTTVEKNLVIKGQAYTELHTGATIDGIDWDSGNVQEVTLPAGSSDFDPSNAKAGATYILKITQPSGGDGTINWDNIGAANIKWPGGTEPTLTATNAAIDIVTLICTDATGQGVYYANATLNFS
tara:strand:+ start:830 stop:1771 length:942 start_codon:yes stop_codon:yes gene_type:complete